MRRVSLGMTVVLLLGVLGIPAFATPPNSGAGPVDGHKITICHATRSLSNPYVVITIDIAAWDPVGDPAPNDHGDHHTRTKGGVTWQDQLAVEGSCPVGPVTTTSIIDTTATSDDTPST